MNRVPKSVVDSQESESANHKVVKVRFPSPALSTEGAWPHLIHMRENELKGCGANRLKTFGYDPIREQWVEEEVPARCGEFLVKVPFEYDQRICKDCAVRLGLAW
jgi:hypothetical protein